MMKALTSTAWGKQKETIVTTYKTIIRLALENANTIWSPTVCKTNLEKLQVVQNNALRIATGCTKDTNIQHLHHHHQCLSSVFSMQARLRRFTKNLPFPQLSLLDIA